MAVCFVLLDTAMGPCAIAWSDVAVVSVQLPEETQASTVQRLLLRVAQWQAAVDQASKKTAAHLPDHTRLAPVQVDASSAPAFVQQAMASLRCLLDGAGAAGTQAADVAAATQLLQLNQVPLDMTGVPEFHQRVYAVVRALGLGRTLSYGEVAQAVARPDEVPATLARPVGQAMARNPFAPIVPCHRVLAAGGKAGGFSAGGGAYTKLHLLAYEWAVLGVPAGQGEAPQPGETLPLFGAAD